MPPLSPQVWYVRKHGWVQGPFTGSLLRRMYATAAVGAVDRVATAPTGPWDELRRFPDLLDDSSNAGEGHSPGGWEVAAPLLPVGRPMEIGLLHIYAAEGRLKPNDLVRQVPDGDWHPAETIQGLFGGRRSWCTACGSQLGQEYRTCQACGSAQPDYETSAASAVFVCAAVGLACYWIAIITITVLALRGTTVYDIPLDEQFPIAYLMALAPCFCLSTIAIGLGRWTSRSAFPGRSSPDDADTLSFGLTLAWTTLGLLLLTGTSVVAFSLPFFGVVR